MEIFSGEQLIIENWSDGDPSLLQACAMVGLFLPTLILHRCCWDLSAHCDGLACLPTPLAVRDGWPPRWSLSCWLRGAMAVARPPTLVFCCGCAQPRIAELTAMAKRLPPDASLFSAQCDGWGNNQPQEGCDVELGAMVGSHGWCFQEGVPIILSPFN